MRLLLQFSSQTFSVNNLSGFIYDDGGIEDGQMISFLLFFFSTSLDKNWEWIRPTTKCYNLQEKYKKQDYSLYFCYSKRRKDLLSFFGSFFIVCTDPYPLVFFILHFFCLHYYKEQDSSVAWQMILEQSREVISRLNPNIHAFQDS